MLVEASNGEAEVNVQVPFFFSAFVVSRNSSRKLHSRELDGCTVCLSLLNSFHPKISYYHTLEKHLPLSSLSYFERPHSISVVRTPHVRIYVREKECVSRVVKFKATYERRDKDRF